MSIELLSGGWGGVTLFDSEGRARRNETFQVRGSPTIDDLVPPLEEVGIPKQEAKTIAVTVLSEPGEEFEETLPPVGFLLRGSIYLILALVGAIFLVWAVVTRIL